MSIKHLRLHTLVLRLAVVPFLCGLGIGIIWHPVASSTHKLAKPKAVKKPVASNQKLDYTLASISSVVVTPTPTPLPPPPTISPSLKAITAPPLSLVEYGLASYYTIASSSNRTASGAPFIESDNTIAHKTLPMWTRVKITNTTTGASVIATVNDRGPYIAGRIADLSPAVRDAISCGGLCPIRLEVL